MINDIELNIMARGSGKTTRITERYTRCSATYKYLIVPNPSRNTLHKAISIPDLYNRCDELKNTSNTIHLFIDEYYLLNLTDRTSLLAMYRENNIKVIIYSTSNMLYDLELINMVKQFKLKGLKASYLSSSTSENYYYNFITEPSCIINKDLLVCKSSLPGELFKLEVLNRWYE